VQDAIRAGKRIADRSGRHCLGNLVTDPSAQAVLDLSEFNGVRYGAT
jgi:hypothetical protein